MRGDKPTKIASYYHLRHPWTSAFFQSTSSPLHGQLNKSDLVTTFLWLCNFEKRHKIGILETAEPQKMLSCDQNFLTAD